RQAPRQVPVPAGRCDGDARRQLRHALPRGVPAPHRRGRLPIHGSQPADLALSPRRPDRDRGGAVSDFRTAFLRARGRLEAGEDPELLVPEVLALAEAPEEIAMAEALYGDDRQPGDDDE